MISIKALKAIEYDKIMADVSNYAVLKQAKVELSTFAPLTTLNDVKALMLKTEEAYKYLYTYDT